MIYTSSCFPPSLVGMHATMQDAIDSWASGSSKPYRPPDLEESLEQAKAIAAAQLGRELTVPEIEAIRCHHPPIDGNLKPRLLDSMASHAPVVVIKINRVNHNLTGTSEDYSDLNAKMILDQVCLFSF